MPLEGQQRQTGAGQECHHTARCQQKETGAVSCKHASKDESGISEAAYAENERLEQERPPLAPLGLPVVRYCPCKMDLK